MKQVGAKGRGVDGFLSKGKKVKEERRYWEKKRILIMKLLEYLLCRLFI